MKTTKLFILFIAGFLSVKQVSAQANATLNILTLNSGQVSLGGIVNVQVTVGNTGPVSAIGVNKVRAQISIPSAIASPLPNINQTGLPTGWTITLNSGGVITVCNGSDIIPVGEQRQILIKVQGTGLGGPSTINGSFQFSNGASCTIPGALAGDNSADNTGTTSIEVVNIVTPVTLTDFNAVLVNCQPLLRWVTQTEVNSDKFEIERRNLNNSDWSTIGTVPAAGTSVRKNEYSFSDAHLTGNSDNVLYRLKMIDKDGRSKYSEVLRVFTNCLTTHINVYPNPVKDGSLYVSLTGTVGVTNAILTSQSGQVILRSKMNIGTNNLNVAGVANGVYVLSIKDGNGFDKKVKVLIKH